MSSERARISNRILFYLLWFALQMFILSLISTRPQALGISLETLSKNAIATGMGMAMAMAIGVDILGNATTLEKSYWVVAFAVAAFTTIPYEMMLGFLLLYTVWLLTKINWKKAIRP